MMLLKCCTQYASKFGKFSSGHRTGKGQFSFKSQRTAMPKMFKLPYSYTHFTCQQSNAQNPSSQPSTVHELRTFRCINWVQKRRRNQKSNCQHMLDCRKKKENSRKTSTSALLTILKSLCRLQQTGKFLKRQEYHTTVPVS